MVLAPLLIVFSQLHVYDLRPSEATLLDNNTTDASFVSQFTPRNFLPCNMKESEFNTKAKKRLPTFYNNSANGNELNCRIILILA